MSKKEKQAKKAVREATEAAYRDFQKMMERYWQKQGLQEEEVPVEISEEIINSHSSPRQRKKRPYSEKED